MNKISNNISINKVRFDEIMIYEFVKNIYCKGDIEDKKVNELLKNYMIIWILKYLSILIQIEI